MSKVISQHKEAWRLKTSGLDYLLLWGAYAVPLYLSGASIRQPQIGVFFVALVSAGMLISYLMNRLLPETRLTPHTGWLQFLVVVVTLWNIRALNASLPEGGFPFQLMVVSILCWYVSIGSFFLWTERTLLFMIVPGIALFGILSWLETGGYFELSLILFIACVAVLLSRLNIRYMLKRAFESGAQSYADLRRDVWKKMAGPEIAILFVLIVAGISWFASPAIGGFARAVTGAPQINFQPPNVGGDFSDVRVERNIGTGPVTSSDVALLRVETDTKFPYIRSQTYSNSYQGLGWNDPSQAERIEPVEEEPISGIPNAYVYILDPRLYYEKYENDRTIVTGISRSHGLIYTPGVPTRIEYNGSIWIEYLGGNNRRRKDQFRITDGLPRGKSYYVESIRPIPGVRDLRSAPPLDKEQYRRFYNQRDRTSERVRNWASEVVVGQPTDYDAVMALMRAVARQAKYNLNAEAITGRRDRVEAFLFEAREGYCDMFASSLAVACRAVGIPARVALGFRLDPESMEDGAFIVRDRHAHMWTEVYFERYGWIAFDPTDLAEAVPGGEVGAIRQDTDPRLAYLRAVWTASIIFGLVFLALIIASVNTWLKGRVRVPAGLKKLRLPLKQFLGAIRKEVDRPILLSETLTEYAEAFAEKSQNGQDAKVLADEFNKVLFAYDEPPAELVESLKENVQRFVITYAGKNGNRH
jgi:transglutaminase-like putative cysteine protease